MDYRQAFIDELLSNVGVVESANNENPYGAEYGMNNAPWCDIFVSICAERVGASSVVGRFAWVPSHIEFFKKRGEFSKRGSIPSPGDIIFFGNESHVGAVVEVSGSYITVVEGNAGSKADRVIKSQYKVFDTWIYGYGHPAWGELSGQPEKEIEVVHFEKVKEYRNGSTPEPVYADSALTMRIGELNPYEWVDAIGIVDGKPMVRYKVDYQRNYKVGFVAWADGLM